jgi:hypothetical protein
MRRPSHTDAPAAVAGPFAGAANAMHLAVCAPLFLLVLGVAAARSGVLALAALGVALDVPMLAGQPWWQYAAVTVLVWGAVLGLARWLARAVRRCCA